MDNNSRTRRVLVDDKYYFVNGVKNGGMGRVWLLESTEQSSLDRIYSRRIAVKTFDFMDDDSGVRDELNSWISLDHPSILPLRRIGSLNYRIAAIMPLKEGSLDDLLAKQGALVERDSVAVLLRLAEGLNYAFTTHRTLHLDLKPSNVLIDRDDLQTVQIADWGLSRHAVMNRVEAGNKPRASVVDRNGSLTSYSAGTPIFMAPERFTGTWKLGPTADIYSLGLIAVQLVSGILPYSFDREDFFEEVIDGTVLRNSRALTSRTSSNYSLFCLKCLNPNPAARFQSFADVVSGLSRMT